MTFTRRKIQPAALLFFLAILQSVAFAQAEKQANEEYNYDQAEARCAALDRQSFETAADSPVKVIDSSYGTPPEATIDEQLMFLKRGQSQGAPVAPTEQLPLHCRVEGYIAPAIKFLIYLPAPSAWNGNVFYAACDGFCGEAADNMPAPGLIRGYATIATNGGHINLPPFDGIWAYNNRQGEIDFGYRSTHLAAQAIKAIAKAFYGRPHRYAFLSGFSKGGTAGIKSAQTYPHDFDGILSRAPVVEYQAKNAVHFPWLYRAVTDADHRVILDSVHIPLIHATVMTVCDGVDGIQDGIIDDPRDCDFDPQVLLCQTGSTANTCLNQAQVEALKKVYGPVLDANGREVFSYPQELGSELDWANFVLPLNGDPKTYAYKGGSSYLKYMAFDEDPGPDYDWLSFDYASEAHKLDAMKPVLDADDPDLHQFRDSGAKIIVVHGWGDGAVSPRMTIAWYNKMQEFMGGSDATQNFARLFLLPGVKHGSGGSGPAIYDALAALETWVEKGTAPEKLILREEENGTVTRTRPVYPYPLRARYDGAGDPNKAASFQPYRQSTASTH